VACLIDFHAQITFSSQQLIFLAIWHVPVNLRPLFSSAAVCFACSAHGNAAAAMSAERRISLRQLIRDESTPLSSRQTKQKLQQCAVMERGNEFAESIFL
jgi:hypothetical protein